jgi:glycosyltransferase involved in cell wall biosynthesis
MKFLTNEMKEDIRKDSKNMKKKKVIFLSNIPAPFQVKFCEELNKSKYIEYNFLFCADNESNRPKHWETKLNNNCIVLKPVYFKNRRLYLNPSIIKVLKQLNGDIIILGGLNIPTVIIANLYYKFLNKERCIFGEKMLPKNIIVKKIEKIFLKLLCGNPEYIFAVGEIAVKEYKEIFRKSKIFNLPYAADIDLNLRHKVRENVSSIKFLFSGQLIERNNPELLLKTFLKIKEKYPKISLNFSGYGPLRDKIYQKIHRELIESGEVKLLENHTNWEELSNDYLMADVLVMPTVYSGWGLVIPEAMASGMGIIAGKNMEAAKNLIQHGHNGYLLSDINEKELEKYMLKYIKNPELVSIHGMRNKELAKTQTYSYRAKQWDEIFLEDKQ